MPFQALFFTNYFWNFRESGAFELTYKGIKNEMETSAPVNIVMFQEHQFYKEHFLGGFYLKRISDPAN